MRYLEGKVYHSADRLLVLSQYTRQRFHEVFNITDDRVTVSPGGVEIPPSFECSRAEIRCELQWHGPVAQGPGG